MEKIKFVAGKGTKNTVIYTEQPAPGGKQVVGTLYVQKSVLKGLAAIGQEYPEFLYVTIEAG